MSKKQTLVNNGLPEGVHFSEVEVGSVMRVLFKDSEPQHVLVIRSRDANRRPTYKGSVSFTGVNGEGDIITFDGDQVHEWIGTQPLAQLTAADILMNDTLQAQRYPRGTVVPDQDKIDPAYDPTL
ncbi:hypothetical protein [Achromobacter phage Motura]|uniref:Uncharacterized protein n=1 Tax=Achromobacter phage Motura TaxID=2591403 RepID=A0A514CSV9_9CAUD|nr:hypothetical protein H1O15_gp234 [Achromobacter phage Motura]QDH83554.1 hypothetical protein [Achromobacter phage Motura]